MLVNKFNKILGSTDPFKVCNGVFSLFSEKYPELDASAEPEPSRTVTLIWHSIGLIGNGGFGYFFEGSFKGDPNFRITINSFKNIGAVSAYQRLRETQQYISDLSPAIRMKNWVSKTLFRKTSEYERRMNQCFGGNEENEITECLLRYIKNNSDNFRKQLETRS